MTQRIKVYISNRRVELISACRFVVMGCGLQVASCELWIIAGWNSIYNSLISKWRLKMLLLLLIGICSCGEPEVKIDRTARRTIDTLVNVQLDSISPLLDSLCSVRKDSLIQYWADSIMQKRKREEERLRLNIPKN